MTTKFSSNSFISLVSYKNLNQSALRYVAIIAAVLFLAMGNVQAGNRYFSRVTGAPSPSAGGNVFVSTTTSKPSTANTQESGAVSTSTNQNQTFYAWAVPNAGYYWSSWTGAKTSSSTYASITIATPPTATQQSLTVKTAKSTSDYDYRSSNNGTSWFSTYRDYAYDYTITANFAAIKVNSCDGHEDLLPTNPSTTYSGSATFTLNHTAATSDLNITLTPDASNHGTFTLGSPTIDGTTVTVNYTFKGNSTNYGGDDDNRNNSATLLVESKGDTGNGKSCTITANFPNAKITDGSATEIYTTYSPADDTQASVAGTAVFDVEYVDGEDNFDTPSITGANASHFTYNYMSYADGKLTVNYTYNGNKTTGDHTATLTLKVKDAIGGTDATYGSKSVTLTAHNEPEATDDAKVIAADGETPIYQGDWATALSKANTAANAGCTLQLLRNVDLGTLTAAQSVTNTFTLDLNGKTLSGIVSSAAKPFIYMNKANKTLTIKDSKTGGKISATGTYTNALYCVQINNGNVILESGTIEIENTNTTQTTANRLYATGVYVNSGKTFTMNGGKIISTRAARDAYGVYVAATATVRGVATINRGEIYTYGNTYAYGIRGYGEININGGTIHAETMTTSNSYAVHLRATAAATAAETVYSGILNMTGGTLEAISKTSTAYGVYSEGAQVASTAATDGTLSNKAAGFVNITGGIINATSTTTTAVGVFLLGDYNSKDDSHVTSIIKNATINAHATTGTAYGIQCNATATAATGGLLQSDVELTDVTVDARTTTSGNTAYAVLVQTAQATGTGAGNTGMEYATGSKAVINSGTYTATTIGKTAYAIVASQRAITYNEGKEGYATLEIHSGKFYANAGTTAARAVHSGGYTTIDGGDFHATAGTSTAYGLFVNTGKLTASGVKVTAEAPATAYGCVLEGNITSYDGVKAGIKNCGEMVLNNLDVTATTSTGNEARGVYAIGGYLTLTQATFDGFSDANKTKYNLTYVMQDGVHRGGSWVCAGKLTINGGIYRATAATTTAYGVIIIRTAYTNTATEFADVEATIKNAKFIVRTNGTTTATGIYNGGIATIEGCTIDVQPKTTTGYGLRAFNTTTVKNSTIDVNVTGTGYGIMSDVQLCAKVESVYGALGKESKGEVLSENNSVTVTATSGDEAYALYLNATKGNTASGPLAGDHAFGASMIVDGGKYTATATGTTAYGIFLKAQTQQGSVYGRPRCTVTGGKFWGKATGGTDGAVNGSGVKDYFELKGGVYNVNTNLSKYIPEGYEEFPLPNDRPEYTEGYRYAIEKAGNHGIYVCQIGSTKYKTLEEALQVVTSGKVIYMIANYTMATPGDYVLPSGATLLIPYKDGTGKGATTAIGNSAETTTSGTTPTLFRKLTFGEGVNLTCFGTIETCAQQKANGQYGANVGMPSGAYGQIHMEEGSHISLESGSRLNCWGYITGKGTIEVKNGGKILEGFQLGDWCGGSNATTLIDNDEKVFPVTHYFYQSIECPITYRPGSRALGSTHIYASSTIAGQDDIALVGTTGSMFLMDDNDVSADTWVMKDYDEATDQCVWTINSGASIGSLTINIEGEIDMGFITMPLSYSLKSADYDLPITTNMSVVLNYGEMGVGQNTVMLPGSKLIVNKQGTAVINGVRVVAYDVDDWGGSKRYFATYSPTWGTTNPRASLPVEDAEVFLHGKVNIKNNGGLYTTANGANIHSTNPDAGEVIYTTAATGEKTDHYYLVQGGTTRPNLTIYPARLKNGDGSYASSAGTISGKTWTYKNDVWDAWSKDGCFLVNAQDKPHAKPAELVELTSKTPDANHLHHDAATGERNFVWDADCYWWEVVTTPTPEGYYQSLNADNNGDYNYYYYDSAAACWKIKKITVTWNINGSTTDYSVGYGTKPEWLGATPSKSSSSSDYVWRWDGWQVNGTGTVYANDDLPFVTENTTFTAHFYEKYYQSLVTFKNDDGTILDSKLWNRGSIPSYEGTPTKEATASQTFEFNGNWSPAITAVGSSPVEYVAEYTATTRQYNVEFVNYDMSVLGTTKVDYNATPTVATYKAAIAPSDFEPYKPDNSAYSFEFSGWRLQGASENGFTQVKGDQIYVAQFTETTKKYLIAFVDDDGETMLHYMQLPYDADIVYDGPVPTTFAANKTNDEWCYTFTGWNPALKDKVDGPQTYMATYKKRSNLVVDIIDWSASKVKLNTTNWALGGWPYTVNGTKYSSDKRAADRTLTIDYSGNPNEMLTIEVYNANGELYSMHSYTIPYVFETSSTLQSVPTSSVIYVNGGSLTINNETEVNAIYVASRAELIVNSPLTVSKLVLRTKETEAASLENNSTIEVTNTYYTRQVSDMAYHQFALPLGVSSTDDVFLSSRAACPYGKTWLLKSYSESERANNGMGAASNWQEVPDKSPIEASRGYELYSGSAFYREFYFPVNLAEVSKEKKVAVGYTSNASAGADNAGWNLLCSPLLGKFEQTFDPNNPEDGIKISQWIDGHYEQPAPPVIYPAVPFYYQAKETGKSLYFTGDKMIVYAPRNSWNTAVPTQWLQLTIHNQYGDKLDETSIYTHPEKFSMNYESGYDVAKQSIEEGNALIYSELSYGKLAFAAVPDSIAETRIPLTAYVAAEGEYIFSMVESNYLGRLQYVFLHDTQTGLVTDLLERDYAVKLAQGTNAGRFYIQCVYAAEAPEISTGVNHLEKDNDKAQKIMYNDKVYIIYQGRVYDMTGRQCELK